MHFPHPKPSLAHLQVRASSETEAVLGSPKGVALDISYLEAVGWCVEARYDLFDHGGFRQPFTGRQGEIEKLPLKIKEKQQVIEISCGGDVLRVERAHGRLTARAGGKVVFDTVAAPFSRLSAETEIPEGLSSPKVVELATHPNFTKLRKSFRSQMVRFEYPAPRGQVLGLPGATGELNRNGYRFELYNTDRWMHTPAAEGLYQSWPVLMHRAREGTGWVAIFHDNPSRTFVDIGAYSPDLVTFEALTNNTRVYIMHAPTLPDLARRAAVLFGTGELPPLWTFGYQQCRYSYLSTAAIRKVQHEFETRKIPLDAVYFDIDYMDGYRIFTRDPKHFGDLRKCVDEIHASGRRAVSIVDPGVKIDPDYFVYKEVAASGGFLRHPDGQPFEITCWPGKALLPDFSAPHLRTVWGGIQHGWIEAYGFDGIWNDMNEPSNFDGGNESSSRAYTHRGELRREFNLYGYGMAQASREGWMRTAPGKRRLVITRSGYPGVQQFAVIWHGDNHAWWEHLRLAIDTAMLYALHGAFYTGTDLPGFSGDPPDDLAVRFFQLGAFLPFFRGHSNFYQKDKEPYVFGDAAREAIYAAIRLRYSLLREWYSGFEHAMRTRELPLAPVLDSRGTVVRDQFELFGKFIVAPVIQRDQSERLVYLPRGRWYRLSNTKKQFSGGAWIPEPVKLGSIPVYVRAGSIVTRNTVRATTHETLAAREKFEIYPDSSGRARGFWFNDDGESITDPHARREELTWKRGAKKVIRRPM